MKAVTYLKQFLSPKALCLIIGGSLVYSIGFNMFILPCNLYNGGFLGIAQLLGYFMRNVLGLSFVTDNYIGIIYFLLNIPLMLLAGYTQVRQGFFSKICCLHHKLQRIAESCACCGI